MELLSITSHVKLHQINCQEPLCILVNPNLNLYIAAAMKCLMKISQIQAFVPLYPSCGIDFGSFILHPASSIQDYYIYNYSTKMLRSTWLFLLLLTEGLNTFV